ncbi:MAG: precorrin-6A reductase [Pseudoflavonifractor sp.]
MEILVFGGTTEGRLLAQWLGARHWDVTLCVATDYGASLIPQAPGLRVLSGRLDGAAMAVLMQSRPFALVVDATHPYAAQVSTELLGAAAKVGLPYERLLREGPPEGEGWHHADTPEQAALLLEEMPGPILLTTGSKDLDVFARPALRERIYPRVLPSVDSLRRCLDLGIPAAHVICMQGPFSQALNTALLTQYEMKTMVTKASGGAGGFWEKAEAARSTGAALLVIDRPLRETGRSYEEMLRFLAQGDFRP